MQASPTASERTIMLVLATAWMAYLAIDIPGSPVDLGALNVAIGFLLGTLTVICVLRGHVLLTAMRLGQKIERESIPGPRRGPRRVA